MSDTANDSLTEDTTHAQVISPQPTSSHPPNSPLTAPARVVTKVSPPIATPSSVQQKRDEEDAKTRQHKQQHSATGNFADDLEIEFSISGGRAASFHLENPHYQYRDESSTTTGTVDRVDEEDEGEAGGEDGEDEESRGKASESSKPKHKHKHKHPAGRTYPAFWALLIFVPTLFIVLVFAIVPLGEPESRSWSEFSVFVFFTSPTVFASVAYFQLVAFLFAVNVDRPFRTYVWPIVCVFFMAIAVPLAMWAGDSEIPPKLYGGWMLLVTFIFILLVIPVIELVWVPLEQQANFRRLYHTFVKVELIVMAFMVVLILYIFAWRYGGHHLQRILPVILAVLTFLTRRILLPVTKHFKLEPAMLMSGFWIENMEDMFSTMAYPSVSNPTSFLIIWVVPAALNIAHLGFMTDRWFRFRMWYKEVPKRLVCPDKYGDPCADDINLEPDLSVQPDDRGYSRNRPGYKRRQARFYLWKILSQLFAMVFYLIVAFSLRFGTNREYFPFNEDELSESDFNASIIFASVNVLFVLVAGYVGVIFLSRRYPDVYCNMLWVHAELFERRKYVAFVIATVTCNGVVVLLVLMRHSQIWYGFDPPDDD